ncbi:MAG TPA: nucleotidyltransferase family protein [Pseudomonadales bacterium]
MAGGAVLLAAGFGRRFGSDKRRHVLPDGTPLLLASLRLYRAAFDDVLVVLRPEDDDLAEAVTKDAAAGPGSVRIVRCRDAHRGMGHSLACGARAAAGWEYLFVALADMAWIRPDTLGRLRETMAAAPAEAVLQPVHHGRPGHPVGFGAAHFPRLTALTGDEGARSVVRAAGPALILLEVDDPGVLEDLDVPKESGG